MPILVYFENAADKSGERDEYGMIVGGGSSYAELSAFFETDAEYMAAFPALVKQAKANNFDMITESDVCEDEEPERVAQARAQFKPKDAHTKGPWRIERDQTIMQGSPIICAGERGDIVTTVYSGDANARLIAAAPELFEALKMLTAGVDCALSDDREGVNGLGSNAYTAFVQGLPLAQQAIAKATEESEK